MKLTVVGDGAIGKTTLCIVMSNGIAPTDYIPTVADMIDPLVAPGDQLVSIWDTRTPGDYVSVCVPLWRVVPAS